MLCLPAAFTTPTTQQKQQRVDSTGTLVAHSLRQGLPTWDPMCAIRYDFLLSYCVRLEHTHWDKQLAGYLDSPMCAMQEKVGGEGDMIITHKHLAAEGCRKQDAVVQQDLEQQVAVDQKHYIKWCHFENRDHNPPPREQLCTRSCCNKTHT